LFEYSDFYPVSVRNWQNDQPISQQRPSYSVWQLSGQEAVIYNQRDKIQMSSQVVNQNDREKSSSHQNEREKPSKSSTSQVTYPQGISEKSYSLLPLKMKENQPHHMKSIIRMILSDLQGQNLNPVNRWILIKIKNRVKRVHLKIKQNQFVPTLGNRFIVHEPKFSQESEGNKQEGTQTSKRVVNLKIRVTVVLPKS